MVSHTASFGVWRHVTCRPTLAQDAEFMVEDVEGIIKSVRVAGPLETRLAVMSDRLFTTFAVFATQ